uniref:Uncharacterized protein n=1 Tax=Hemiselmis andersenii TaxID=464988 RepID=A0A7S1DTI3_HEMAN
MIGGLRGVWAVAEEEEYEYEDLEGAVEAAADVLGKTIDAVSDSADAPDMVKLVAKAVVAVGVVLGLGILYIPPNIQTIETIEVNPGNAEEREKLIETIEKLTGEEFPDKKKKES